MLQVSSSQVYILQHIQKRWQLTTNRFNSCIDVPDPKHPNANSLAFSVISFKNKTSNTHNPFGDVAEMSLFPSILAKIRHYLPDQMSNTQR